MQRCRVRSECWTINPICNLAVICSDDTDEYIKSIFNNKGMKDQIINIAIGEKNISQLSFHILKSKNNKIYILDIDGDSAEKISQICNDFSNTICMKKYVMNEIKFSNLDTSIEEYSSIEKVVDILVSYYYTRRDKFNSFYTKKYFNDRKLHLISPLNMDAYQGINSTLNRISSLKKDAIEKERFYSGE